MTPRLFPVAIPKMKNATAVFLQTIAAGGLALAWFSGCDRSADIEGCVESGMCQSVVEVLKVPGDLPLEPDAEFWNSSAGPKRTVIDLGPQMITNPKWPNPSVKTVTVSAARNAREIAIWLQWEDATLDNRFGHSSLYTDQAALMFPLKPGKDFPAITMGDEDRTVNVWQWKAAWEKSSPTTGMRRFQENSRNALNPAGNRSSPVEDLNAEGFSTLTIQEHQDVLGKGVWRDKAWSVVLKRSLTNADGHDIQFKHSVAMAVAVWNGANRERNGQKGIADWILLRFI